MILVTGGTGHLGSHVLYELVKKNKPVRAIYRNINHLSTTREVFSYYESGDDSFNKIEWIEADINDYYALCNSLRGISHVFHTAGYVSFNDKERVKLNHINADGTANIVNACLETGNIRLCHVSSIAALGELADGLPVNETILWNQGETASAYAKSKYQAEMEVWRGIHEGLNALIVNPSVIIGPGMWLGPGRNLWKSVQQGLGFYAIGSAGYVDVRDVASIMIWLSDLEISGERFILNSGHMTHREFLGSLAKGLKAKEPHISVTPFLSRVALIIES
ncbi:MAG TPA: NAD-dependent epimerase/dehydratase family protein, partial [Bacteroidales bacterium]|nr:NAD-dependent epimerase/dehydratase family protein [Bacteroidales bacterium]